MRRILVSLLGLAVLIGAIWLPVGCSVGGGSYSFLKMMTCPSTPQDSEGDLSFFNLLYTPLSAQPMPGDYFNLEMTVGNNAPPGAGVEANISMASAARVFFSFDNQVGPEDYLAGEIPISGIPAGGSQTVLSTLVIPRATAPPTTADVTLGTGNLNTGVLNTNFPVAGNLATGDWIIVRAPAPSNVEAFMLVTGVAGGNSVNVQGNHPNGDVVNNATIIRTDKPKYFPFVITSVGSQNDPDFDERDPNRPEYIGPETIAYNMIVVIDSQNCVRELNEPTTPEYERYDPNNAADGAALFAGAYNGADPRLNNQAIASLVDVMNPNLPNLQVRFVDRQPANDLPQLGGVVNTRWEFINDGVSPVTQPFLVQILFSETENFSSWDRVCIEPNYAAADRMPNYGGVDLAAGGYPPGSFAGGWWEVTVPVPGNSNRTEIMRVRFPYWTWRSNANAYPPSSSLWAWITGGGHNFVTREPPPNGPPGYFFGVHLPIPTLGGSTNYLLAEVDSVDTADPNTDPGGRVRESNEYDNWSYNIQNGNGQITVGFQNDTAPLDIGAVDLQANFDIQQNRLYCNLRYDNEHPAGDVCVAWYFSQNDTAQSADYMWNNFWYLLQSGQAVMLSAAIQIVADLPAQGQWYIVGVLDCNFRYPKRKMDNNHVISNGPTFIW